MQLAEIAYQTAVIMAGVWLLCGIIITSLVMRGYQRITGQEAIIRFFKEEQDKQKADIERIKQQLGLSKKTEKPVR